MDLLDKHRALMARAAPFMDNPALFPGHTVIDDVHGPCEVTVDGQRTLMFGSNNYLGLTHHPDVIEAAKAAMDHFGAGTTGSRVANGTLALHKELEHELARRFGKQHGMIFTTGYQANLGTICGLCGPEDTILIDADSHASIFDAVRLSGAQVFGFRHNSPDSLAQRLGRLPAGERNRLVIIEGLYSIKGDLSPVEDIVAVCRQYGAYLLVDEAHSFGVYGAKGLGWCEERQVLDQVDFVVGTFSKTLAGVGGFCVSNHFELLTLHFISRPYLFTASAAAANVAGVRAALDVLDREPERRERLWSSVRRLREGLIARGYRLADTRSPIVAIYTGDEDRTIAMWRSLLEAGVYVNLVLPPSAPKDDCVLRASCSAAHTSDHIDRALDVFAAVAAGDPAFRLAPR